MKHRQVMKPNTFQMNIEFENGAIISEDLLFNIKHHISNNNVTDLITALKHPSISAKLTETEIEAVRSYLLPWEDSHNHFGYYYEI